MNCLAHLINLVVKIIFEHEGVIPILTKSRKLVGTFKHSTVLSEQLSNVLKTLEIEALPLFVDQMNDVDFEILTHRDEQESVNENENKNVRTKLVQDMATRWNSTLAMFTSVYQSHSAIRHVILRDIDLRKKYSNELLTDYELGVLEDMINLLKPFLEITKLSSGSRYVTSSIILPAITRLKECLMLFESKNGNKFLESELAFEMSENLAKRTDGYFKNPIIIAATFMDPRYRSMKFIKDQNERDTTVFKALSYIKKVYLSIR